MDDLAAIVEVLGRGEPPPPLVPPVPSGEAPEAAITAAREAVAPAMAGRNPCHSVTLPAVREVRDAINKSLIEAREDEALNGSSTDGGGNPPATRSSVAHLTAALDRTDRLLKWLEMGESEFFDQQGFMMNTSASYSVYGNLRDVVWQLHHGRHWSAVSCAYNSPRASPPRDNTRAIACIESATRALDIAEPLGADATRCYIRAYI